jgi:hypothetical protein
MATDATMGTEEQNIFATRPWCTIPFAVHPKTVTDRLVDILLLIPGCLSLYNQINYISGLDIQKEQRIRLQLELEATSQLQDLHAWWEEYTEGEDKQGGKEPSSLYGLGGRKDPCGPNDPYFRDAFTAACTASYHAANVILYSMLSFTSSQPHSYDPFIESHTSYILAAASYLMTNSSYGATTLVMAFPLKIVWRWALVELERQSAYEILQLWGQKKGFSRICTQADPMYEIPTISATRTAGPLSS